MLWRTSSEVFVMLLFFISFLIFLLLLFFICRCSSFTFLFGIIPHLFLDYRRVFTSISYFHPSPSQSDLRLFHFLTIRLSSYREGKATVLRGHFLPTDVFYLTLLRQHFTSVYQGFPGSRQFFLNFAGLHTDPLKRDLAHLFV